VRQPRKNTQKKCTPKIVAKLQIIDILESMKAIELLQIHDVKPDAKYRDPKTGGIRKAKYWADHSAKRHTVKKQLELFSRLEEVEKPVYTGAVIPELMRLIHATV